MNVLIIHNAASGQGDSAIYDFARMYAEDGDSVTIRTVKSEDTRIESLLGDANQFDFVVAAGGDGTVTSVASALSYTNVPVLVFPAGTANLLALNLLLPDEPHALSRVADEAIAMDFDLGEITSSDGTKIGFSIMCGCGYDNTIMEEAKPNKKILGALAYFHAAFANPKPQKSNFKLTIDGITHETRGIFVLVVNFSRIQMDMMVSESNLPRDGMFDVVVAKTETALELIPTLFAKFFDKTGEMARKMGSLELYRGRDIYIEADPPMCIEYDGEPTKMMTPMRVVNLHNAARFIVGANCIEHFMAESPDAPEPQKQ